jgi:hypothetical protein
LRRNHTLQAGAYRFAHRSCGHILIRARDTGSTERSPLHAKGHDYREEAAQRSDQEEPAWESVYAA